MLFLIGIGMGAPKDLTERGVDLIRKSKLIFLEAYTSLLVECAQFSEVDCSSACDTLERVSGCRLLETHLDLAEGSIQLADRATVEEDAEDLIIRPSLDSNVALLVVGDPFGATTHADLYLRAVNLGVSVEVVHNASILTAVGCTGLQLYRFGETVSLCFWTDTWKPCSFFEKLIKNYNSGLHTLCLLDIKVKERLDRKVYQPPRFMTANQAAEQILYAIDYWSTSEEQPCSITGNSLCVAALRLGSSSQRIVSTSLKDLSVKELGPPLHSLIIPSKDLHEIERDMLNIFN